MEENKNIFEGAKFRDAFLTRDKHVVIYRDILNDTVQCIIEGDEYRRFTTDVSYTKDGRAVYENRFKPEWDIVSRYQEEIDEEKLDELAEKLYQEEAERNLWQADKESFFCGVKAGYHQRVKDER